MLIHELIGIHHLAVSTLESYWLRIHSAFVPARTSPETVCCANNPKNDSLLVYSKSVFALKHSFNFSCLILLIRSEGARGAGCNFTSWAC